MTSYEDLSPEAKSLLRQAKGADRATRSEVTGAVQRFRHSRAQSRTQSRTALWQLRAPWGGSRARRATPWAVCAAILSGALGAYATVGQSFGLPMPAWWTEFSALPAFNDTAQNRSPAEVGHPTPKGAGSKHDQGQTADGARSVGDVSPTPATLDAPVASLGQSGAELARLAAARSSAHSRAPVVQTGRVDTTGRDVEPSVTPTSPALPALSAGPLAQEVQTITAARDALNAGNCAVAVRHLDAHRAQFPNGALSEERQALAAICQCRAGKGTTAAHDYVARRPNSPLARRVARECSIEPR